MGDWCTIESDPGVFTELISRIGVKGVQVEEIWDLDNLDNFKPCHGLIFLFKYKTESKDEKRPELAEGVPGVFFAKQMITNACATQAIISILMNRPQLELGRILTEYRSFTMDMTPDIRGLAISNSAEIQKIHNDYSRPEPFVMETRQATEDDDVFHFIAYVPVNGHIYELDGLRQGPILIDECTEDNWTDKIKPAIRARMQRYSQSETSFNLLALVPNIKDKCEAELKELKEAKANAMDTSDGTALIDEQIRSLEGKIRSEDAKFLKWKNENIRRRHSYVPFIFNLLKILAKTGKLEGLVEEANKADAARPLHVQANQ